MQHRELAGSLESLAITLEPVFPQAEDRVPAGVLRIAWGQAEFSVDWEMIWP